MKLDEINIVELLQDNLKVEQSFVLIPFLYSPVLHEIKRKEALIKDLCLEINCEQLYENEVYLSILRLFGRPEELIIVGSKTSFVYSSKIITIQCSTTGLMFSGYCELEKSTLIFSENSSYITIQNTYIEDSIIVLPEGDGLYYMKIDKKESESADRLSIIGDPNILKKHLIWFKSKLDG